MKKVASVFITALLVALLAIKAQAQFEEFVPYIPDSSQVELNYWRHSGISYMNITIQFPDTGFNISSWGTLDTTGNNISVDAEIWRYTGLSIPLITTISHTYSLGLLPQGEYNFFFEVWEALVKNTTFDTPPEIIVPDDYPTIQEAINAASHGNTIFVRNGTYYEHVVVNKSLALIGENREVTIIDGNGTGTVVYITANHVSVKGFLVRNSGSHIGLRYAGICLDSIQNCNISGNQVIDNDYGINILFSSNLLVDGNLISCSHGIFLHQSANSTVFENNMYECSLRLDYSSDNKVSRNTVSNGAYYGIRLYSSSGNVLNWNDVSNSSFGIHIVDSSDNTIYHNSFRNNSDPAYIDRYSKISTTWERSGEGNYWSNYNGTDLDGDGIGDTDLPWEGVDNYPLMNPYWWNPGDINHDLKIDIYDVVRITAVYSSQEGDFNWNPHADIAEPYGIIDIYDVVTCTKDYGQEWNCP